MSVLPRSNRTLGFVMNKEGANAVISEAKPKPTVHGRPTDGRGITGGPSRISAAPLTRQFWRAGSYDGGGGNCPKASVSVPVCWADGENHAHVHPMFLHSNATSHKWVFGAVAELLDNAIDEIQNGATAVLVDRTVNPRDGSPALLIQDNGAGMDPEALRRCMSFGFSDKSSKAAIGQYGNGFKTSTMRLGADVIVFSRHKGDRLHSQSIGLLSYTFLTQTGCNRIIVPMVDYELNGTTGRATYLYDIDHYDSNISLLLHWSPYSTEADLLKQFSDVGSRGTKVVIYNLWMTDEQKIELDFDSDPLDIRLSGDIKKVTSKPQWKSLHEKHIANQLHYSLRVYLSILYLRVPDGFTIVLRGQAVEHHNIADDLKHIEYILYKPQTGGTVEGQVVTTIGFLKEAPNINIHGFNVYHKNRLILPFWHVLSSSNSSGRGVVGVLEANFVEPTHNKQDFERTSLFQKLEVRLKEMAREYWTYHCGLIGYHAGLKRLQSGCTENRSRDIVQNYSLTPVTLLTPAFPLSETNKVPVAPLQSRYYPDTNLKRKEEGLPEIKKPSHLEGVGKAFFDSTGLTDTNLKRKAEYLPEIKKPSHLEGVGKAFLDNMGHPEIEAVNINQTWTRDSDVCKKIEEHRRLRAMCTEYEKSEQELKDKLANLRSELENAQKEHARLLAKSRFLEQITQDRTPK